MKKYLFIIMLIFIVNSSLRIEVAADVSTSAKGAVVMDVKTCRVLYSKNMNTKLEMASTTKIMTALLAVESGKLNDVVTVKQSSCNIEGSSLYLKPGDKLTIEELLYGLMLRSGNDASVAIAEYIGGNYDNFIAMMNTKATELGANNTHFVNPNGLPDMNHYTTAYDLALITSYAMKNSKFSEIVSSKNKVIPGSPSESWDRVLKNKNKMLWSFIGADGVKTGYTKNAGRCLVTSATRNNMRLVCVVLNCGPMWEESAVLLENTYKSYNNVKLVDKEIYNKKVTTIKGKQKYVNLIPLNDIIIPIKENEADKVEIKTNMLNEHIAPIYKGAKAGEICVYIEKALIAKTSLIYQEDVKSSDILYNLRIILKNLN